MFTSFLEKEDVEILMQITMHIFFHFFAILDFHTGSLVNICVGLKSLCNVYNIGMLFLSYGCFLTSPFVTGPFSLGLCISTLWVLQRGP